jgi:hypothetical protein
VPERHLGADKFTSAASAPSGSSFWSGGSGGRKLQVATVVHLEKVLLPSSLRRILHYNVTEHPTAEWAINSSASFWPFVPVQLGEGVLPVTYLRLTFMMLDADIVAVSPSSVWRVLNQAGLLSKWNGKPWKKGTGFEQPLAAHQHWHIDVSYINISGTFY